MDWGTYWIILLQLIIAIIVLGVVLGAIIGIAKEK